MIIIFPHMRNTIIFGLRCQKLLPKVSSVLSFSLFQSEEELSRERETERIEREKEEIEREMKGEKRKKNDQKRIWTRGVQIKRKMGTRTRRVRNQSSVKHTLFLVFLFSLSLFFHSLFLFSFS